MTQASQLVGGKILTAVDGPIATLTFNQPEKRNAMSVEMWAGLETALSAWEVDDSVRMVVLTGAGEKAFVSGADISQFEAQRSDANAQQEYEKQIRGGRDRLARFPKPIIARIRGFCLGGGLAIAMQADIRIASADAEFGIPATRMGIAYGFPSIRRLVQLVGPANASTILLTAERIDAAEAFRIGLVNRVVPVDQLDAAVQKLTTTIANNAPLSVRANKLTIDTVLMDPADRDLKAIEQASNACFNSEDYREGRTAFLEKRPPKFKGQ